jgi:phage-related protein
MPQSRPMPTIGAGCHELRIRDGDKTWRIVYFVAADAILVLCVFQKTTEKTPHNVIKSCRARLGKL